MTTWIKPRSPLPPPRVFDAAGREIVLDEDQAVPPGARVVRPLFLTDHVTQGDTKVQTFMIDGKTMEAADAVAHLQQRVSALENELSSRPVADAATRVRDHLIELERRKTAPQTPAEKRAFEVSNAWKQQPAR